MAKGFDTRSWVALGIVSVVVALFGYLLLTKLGRIEVGLADVGVRMSEIGEDARTAAADAADASLRSQEAIVRANAAEESARDAAAGREAAEQTAARAEVTASMANAEARDARAELERIQRERQQEIERLTSVLGRVVDTQRTAAGLVMNLGTDAIEFDFDRSELRPAERELLSRIAGILLTTQGFSLYVYGHTDDVGTEAYNQALSERRANAVRDYLVEAGIDSAIIESRGYGKSSPLVPGDTDEARQKNRRVEIGLVDVFLNYATSAGP